MRVFAQPTVSCYFEQVCALSWIWDKDSSKEVSSMRCDIFGEGKRGRDNVFIQKVDVVSFRIGWIVVERQISCEHSILEQVS